MTTRIVPGNLRVTSATQRKHWLTSITQTPRHPGPFQSHQRISYYFSKRGRSLLQVFTPNKYLLIAWKSIFREGVVLRLGTPNSVLTDLVVFLLFLYLIRLTYDSHAVPMLLSFFHIMPHAPLIPFISVQCMAMSSFLLLPFCHCRAVASCIASFPFHGRAWCTLLPHATRVRNILEQSSVDPIQTCTYTVVVYKGASPSQRTPV